MYMYTDMYTAQRKVFEMTEHLKININIYTFILMIAIVSVEHLKFYSLTVLEYFKIILASILTITF